MLDTRILIADDDAEDQHIMFQIFKELGYASNIVFVADGPSLLSYISQSEPGAVGLIILDLNMPKLNGTETLRMLKGNNQFRHIPVIIFSTSVNEIEKSRCFELGAKDYLTKPTRYSEYIDTCKRFFQEARAHIRAQ